MGRVPSVAALYRFPIKGLNPEHMQRVRVQPDGRIMGDRVLTFRYANALEPVDRDGFDYWDKGGGLCVRDYGGLTLLGLDYDERGKVIEIQGPSGFRVRADLSGHGRNQLCEAITEYVRTTPEGGRLERDGRLPLHLIGDGVNAKFQDRARGYVTLHNRASLRELQAALGVELDEVRFRSNIAIDGIDAWAEDDLIGQQIRIGELLFDVIGPINRCLATHANPDTGRYDVQVMQALTRKMGRKQPSFGVLLLPAEQNGTGAWGGAEVRVGQPVQAIRSA